MTRVIISSFHNSYFWMWRTSIEGITRMATEYDLTPGISWPTIFYSCAWQEHPTEAPGIIEHLYQIKASHKDRIASGIAVSAKSQYGIFESPFDLFDSPHPGMAKLRDFILEALQLAISHVNGSQVEPE